MEKEELQPKQGFIIGMDSNDKKIILCTSHIKSARLHGKWLQFKNTSTHNEYDNIRWHDHGNDEKEQQEILTKVLTFLMDPSSMNYLLFLYITPKEMLGFDIDQKEED
jgi:hypothetical protein